MDERELVAVIITADGRKVPMRLGTDSPARTVLERLRRRIRELTGR